MTVVDYLDEMNVKYSLDPFIVRGLDYYSRTAWELFSENDKDEKLTALGGGGRYDALMEILGGRATPAVGFAIGMERVAMKMMELKVEVPRAKSMDIYIAQLGAEARKRALVLFEDLRKEGFSVGENLSKKGLRDQLDIADKKGVKYTLILGQKEIADGTVIIRDMESGVQEVVDFNKSRTEIRKRLASHEAKNLKLKK